MVDGRPGGFEMRFGLRGPRRRVLAVGCVTVALLGFAGSLGLSPAQADSTRAAYRQHNGADGETDVNICSDAVPAGQARCMARMRTDAGAADSRPTPALYEARVRGAGPQATIGNNGAYDPAYLESAYNAPSATAGAGQTVAIVDAYDDPNAAADLSYYRSFFGLPACTTANGCFKKVNENGGSSLPARDVSWAQEIALDLDMVSAMCPRCNILLVEASSATMSDLGTAVNTAVRLGAKVVSNSYAAPEYSGEPADGGSYYNHPGVAIVAASGDTGYGVEFPAAASTVTAVGGTSLTQSTNTGTRNATETAWTGAGSGCSTVVAKPAWQADTGCPMRAVADVSAVADPNTGVWVYDTYGTSGFQILGGTSVATPIIGSMYALAGNPTSNDNLAVYPYAHPGSFNDVTSGSNGTCPATVAYLCTSVSGFDGPTGLGTPNGVSGFGAGPVLPAKPSAPQGLTVTGGNATVSLGWSAPASSGSAPVTSYNVYRGTSPGGEGTSPMSTGVTATTYTDATATNGTTYYYTVTAVNAVGEGTASGEASATPQVPSPPGAPQHLVATGAPASVALSWSAPSSTGGAPVSYSVYRGTTPGGESAVAVASGLTGTNYTDPGLTNGTTYYYTVVATNTAGPGVASNESFATPAAVPGAPVLTAATSSSRGVTLSWTAPTANGSPIIQYALYRGTRAGGETSYVNVTCNTSTCSYNDTGARSRSTYYYQAAAVNAVGTGPRSNEAHARAR